MSVGLLKWQSGWWIPGVALALGLVIAAEAQEPPMTDDALVGLATRYAAAWSSQDPERLASFYSETGSLRVNAGDPSVGRAAIEETARGFMTGFPDMVVKMVRISLNGEYAEFHWLWTGTNTGPGGTGNTVRITGYEEWTIDADGMIAESRGRFDESEYQRQLNAGSDGAESPACPTTSRFGPSDEVGNLNYLTPEKTLAASKLVTQGKVYRLGIETNKDLPAYPPRTFSITVVQPGQTAGGSLGPTRTTYNDDIIAGWVGIGSQIDGLGHVGIDNLYFNCNRAPEFAMADGLTKLGIETVPAVATRGVLLDMAGYFETEIVEEGTAFNRAEIEGAMKRQGIEEIGKGDVVLFYTGWLRLIGEDNERFGSAEPGLGLEGAEYLASLGVAIVGADTWGVEVVPFEAESGVFEVHQVLLALNGIYTLENIDTEEMVRDEAWESLFTLGPARITGAVQAIVNPIAIR